MVAHCKQKKKQITHAYHTTAFANLRDFQSQLGEKLACCSLWRDEITSEIPLIPKLFCRTNNVDPATDYLSESTYASPDSLG